LLDEDFVHAYCHGIVLKCADGVLQRVFPHIFTHSADYPEKYTSASTSLKSDHSYNSRALIATMKDMGSCTCPHCLTPKNLFGHLGLIKDMKNCIMNLCVYAMTKVVEACEYIYQRGNTVDGLKVEDALGDGSWVPTLVSMNDSFWFVISSNQPPTESICLETWTAWTQPIPHACCRLYA
jgi:hypothetical protein